MVTWKALTAFELLYLAITFGGFVAVVVSLCILTRQTRLLTRQTELLNRQTESLAKQTEFLNEQTRLLATTAKCATYASITNNLTITKQIFIQYPHLRPYFYEGLDIPRDDDRYSQVEGVAEHLLDFFDGILLQEETKLWPANLWDNYIKDCFRRSKVLQNRLKETSDWYTGELANLMTKALSDDAKRNA